MSEEKSRFLSWCNILIRDMLKLCLAVCTVAADFQGVRIQALSYNVH